MLLNESILESDRLRLRRVATDTYLPMEFKDPL